MEVQAVAPNIVRIHFQPGGKTTPRTLVMDPAFQPAATAVRLEKNGQAQTLTSSEMKVVVDESGAGSVQVQDGAGKALVTVKGAAAERQRGGRDAGGGVTIEHDANENLYGRPRHLGNDRSGGQWRRVMLRRMRCSRTELSDSRTRRRKARPTSTLGQTRCGGCP